MRWYYGWTVIVFAMIMQAVIWGLGSLSFTFWVLPWIKEFGASRGEIMMGITGALIVMGISAPLAGWAMDRFSIRLFICLGLVSFSLGFSLISQASATWQVIALYAIFVGLSGTFAGPLVAQILAAKWFNAKRGLALGISATGQAWGGMIMPRFVTTLIADHGWRGAALMVSAVPLLLIPLIWLTIRSGPGEMGLEKAANVRSASRYADAPAQDWTTSTILRDRGFVLVVLVFTPMMTAIYAILQNLAPYSHDHGFPPAAAASFMAVLSVFLMLGKITFGALSDHIDKRWLVWVALSIQVVSFGALITGPTDFWYMLCVCALLGFGAGAPVPLTAAIIGNRFGTKAFGRAMGLLYPFTNLCAIGPVLMGWMRDEMGSYSSAIWIFILSFVPAALLMAYFPQGKRPEATNLQEAPELN